MDDNRYLQIRNSTQRENHCTADEILDLLRGMLIFDGCKHDCERYFLVGYVMIDYFYDSLLLNYMFVGYLVMGIMIWQHENSLVRDSSNERPLI